MRQHQRGEPPHWDAAQDTGGQGKERVGSRNSNPASVHAGAAEAGGEVRGDQGTEEYSHQVEQVEICFIEQQK